jgi:hypothetical protein
MQRPREIRIERERPLDEGRAVVEIVRDKYQSVPAA